jgi:hypothetical protein
MSVQRKNFIPVLVAAFILAGSLVLGSPQAAQACMTPVECYFDVNGNYVCTGGGGGFDIPNGLTIPGDTKVTMLPNHRALIKVGTYSTPEMTNTYNCAVTLAPVPGVKRVNRVTLVDAMTGQRLPNYSFVRNGSANSGFSSLLGDLGIKTAREGNWQGFSTEVLNGSKGGIIHSFLLEVTLEDGVTPRQLLKAIRAHGMLSNGSANPDGTLDYGHYFLRDLGAGGLTVIAPR